MSRGGKGAVPMHGAELSVLGAQQKPAGATAMGCSGPRGCGKLLVQTQFQNNSGFQQPAAPGRGTCLLNKPVPIFRNSFLLKFAFSARGIFLSVLRLHLVEDTAATLGQLGI